MSICTQEWFGNLLGKHQKLRDADDTYIFEEVGGDFEIVRKNFTFESDKWINKEVYRYNLHENSL